MRIRYALNYSALGLVSAWLAIAPPPALASFPYPPPSLSSATTTAAASPTSSTLQQGRILYESGRFSEALPLWQQAVQDYAAQGDRANQALSLSYLSLMYQQLHQWDKAKQAIEESFDVLETSHSTNAILWAQVLNTQASLLSNTGQTQAALETWQEAEKYYRQAKDSQGMTGSQINQAQALQNLGFYRRSRQLLETIHKQLASAPDSALKVNGLRSLGTTLRAIGDLTAGQKALEESLAISQRLGRTNDISPILVSIGNTAADVGETHTALQYFQRAEEFANKSSDRLEAQLDQLRLHAEQGQVDQATPIAQEIQQQLANLPPSRDAIYGSVNLANTLAKFNPQNPPLPPQQVAQLLANAVQSARNMNDPRSQAYALSEWGQLYSRHGQTNDAIPLLRQSLQLAQSVQAKDIISQSAWKLGRLLRQTGQRQEAIAAYGEAVQALQGLRGDLVGVNQDVQFSFRESVEPVYREFVGLLLDTPQPNQPTLIKVRELIEALQLAELDNFFREACLDAQPQQIDQLDPNAAVVYSITLPDQLAVILSAAGQPLRYHKVPISQAETEQTLRALLAALHPASDNTERLRLSQEVYNWLIRPSEESQALKGKKTLVFVLDGLTRKIPMAALHDGKQYLIEKYGVVLSPGLRLMSAQALEQQQIRAVVGGISEGRNGFTPLPAVEGEVTQIAQAMKGSKLLNQQLTKPALAEQVKAKSANLVHLATHGQFSSNLEETFLLTWEGRMNIRELSKLLRSRQTSQQDTMELLVLSACDTADGDDRAVLGLAGLAIKSGARSTMATLWPVKDKVAARLMMTFYQEMRKPNATKSEALRQAQLSLLGDQSYNDPFFWSSFVLVGNWL
jgi:CHAT domain-containing protein